MYRRFKFRSLLFYLLCATALSLGTTLRATDFYAAPGVSAGGDGSFERPWTLGNALKGFAAVQPGDTIWLRGGVYRANDRPTKFFSLLQGAENNPVNVREFPGERAIIDGNLTQLEGGWVNYWDFEIMNSLKLRATDETGPFPKAFQGADGRGNPTDFTVSGFDLRAPQVKLINMFIHDSIGGGIALSAAAANPEIYGTFSFHNGWQGGDRGHGHGLYGQNVSPSVALIRENAFFSNYALGVQTTGTGPVADNFRLVGNVFFFNSSVSRERQGNVVLGTFSGQSKNISLLRNFFFETNPSGTDVNFGYTGGISNGVVQGNYFATRVAFSPHNQDVRVVRNTTVNANAPGQQPNVVQVRPNQYQPGRAHIIVYNWEGLPQVSADLSSALAVGTAFEIRSAQDILGTPIIQGVYAGGSITLPMTGLPVAKTFLQNATAATAPRFNLFVVIPQSNNGAAQANTPPTISSIGDQVTVQNKETDIIRFTTRDRELPPDFLNISVSSSNPELVPIKNIRFMGNGVNRRIRVRPAKDQTGTSLIQLFLSDGIQSTTTSFTVIVNSALVEAQ